MDTKEVLEKYFKNERIIYFHSSDLHQIIAGDTYLTYKKTGIVELWLGTNDGEVCLLCTRDGDRLEALIKAMIY